MTRAALVVLTAGIISGIWMVAFIVLAYRDSRHRHEEPYQPLLGGVDEKDRPFYQENA